MGRCGEIWGGEVWGGVGRCYLLLGGTCNCPLHLPSWLQPPTSLQLFQNENQSALAQLHTPHLLALVLSHPPNSVPSPLPALPHTHTGLLCLGTAHPLIPFPLLPLTHRPTLPWACSISFRKLNWAAAAAGGRWAQHSLLRDTSRPFARHGVRCLWPTTGSWLWPADCCKR